MNMFAYLVTKSPVPNDLELVIPGDLPLFEVLLVAGFILHIIFVNILVAGTVSAIYNEIKGIRMGHNVFDQLSYRLATQISIFKSIAVVLGIAPLLIISTIYTQFFYPSTILIGKMWLTLIPLLIVAFLALYVYKFTWQRWQTRKKLHLAFGLLGMLILLFVPLLFITNVASMLQPELWEPGRGFWRSLFAYPTIWQRYLHFMAASFSMMGLFMYGWGKRRERKDSDSVPVWTEYAAYGKRMAALFTALQLLAGPMLLLSMDKRVKSMFLGGSWFHTGLLTAAIGLALVLLWLLLRLAKQDNKRLFLASLALLLLAVTLMSWIRHEVRELYLAPYMEEAPRTLQK
ncbi:cytochrome c class I [Paenibacillus athensensis]|uniref:Cytochrome c class I n=1 Tax=Paenibacillus athensensis TaxID=1967502 RepID=A0A4Y8PYQ2_9BACL|nr:cytochrome c class I [Paenibacillus athensensis]MCD1261237.1 cytochrome c class I [Paenibacillus athensensis]